MTSFTLVLWIVAGVALQMAMFLAIAFWRHWRNYQALKARESETTVPIAPERPVAHATDGAVWSGFRTFRVTHKRVEDGAGSVCSFHLEPDDRKTLPTFLPGQFLTFRLDIPDPAGGAQPLVRCYSLSDAPHPDHYRVTIKRVPAPAGTGHPAGRSSNFFHDQVEVGSTLNVRAPSGHFYIDEGDGPVVLIAGGIGITPMLSMLNACLANQPGRDVWLFHGVRNSRETIMKAHLDALAAAHPNFHLRLCFSNPLPEDEIGRDYQHWGRVEVALLRMELPLRAYHFYVCGPTAMMETLVPALEDWGVPDARIHFEAFGPASIRLGAAQPAVEAVEAGAGSILVTFARSGRQLTWQPGAGTLLELAEANGVKVESGCRAGSCGTCQTTIRSGEVAYRHPPDYDPEPGTCLLCVCAPKTGVTLEA